MLGARKVINEDQDRMVYLTPFCEDPMAVIRCGGVGS